MTELGQHRIFPDFKRQRARMVKLLEEQGIADEAVLAAMRTVHYKGQRGEGIYPVAFEGLIKNCERRYRETGSDAMKQEYESFMRITPCLSGLGRQFHSHTSSRSCHSCLKRNRG